MRGQLESRPLCVVSPTSNDELIITLRYAIWDSGDAILDSLVLIDKFEWSEDTPEIRTVPISVD